MGILRTCYLVGRKYEIGPICQIHGRGKEVLRCIELERIGTFVGTIVGVDTEACR